MKTLAKFAALAAAIAALAGCRDLGYNGKTLNNESSPGVTQQAYTRTYDQNGNPVVTPAPVPGTNDPAAPNYRPAGN